MGITALFKARPERDALRSAIATRDAAVSALKGIRENEARLEAIVIAHRDSARAATEAAREEREARARAVRQGSKFTDMRDLVTLEAKTAEAQRLAERTKFDADVARQELHTIAATVRTLEYDMRNAEAAIDREVGALLVAEFEPTLKRLERIAADYHAVLIEVAGIHDYVYSVAPEGERRISQSLNKARSLVAPLPDYQYSPNGGTPLIAPPAEVIALTQAWRKRAALLRANPNAE